MTRAKASPATASPTKPPQSEADDEQQQNDTATKLRHKSTPLLIKFSASQHALIPKLRIGDPGSCHERDEVVNEVHIIVSLLVSPLSPAIFAQFARQRDGIA